MENKYEQVLNFFNENNIRLNYEQIQELYNIVDRHTVGLDENLLDNLKKKKNIKNASVEDYTKYLLNKNSKKLKAATGC